MTSASRQDRLQAERGDAIDLHYTARTLDGATVDSTCNGAPLRLKIGSGALPQGLEESILGMSPEESKTIFLPKTRGFGEHHQERIERFNRALLPAGFTPVMGQRVALSRGDGRQCIGTIVEVDDGAVSLDLNHPLAGKDLIFDLQLVGVHRSVPDAPASGVPTIKECFQSYHYQRHNQRRQEHLAALGLELSGLTVLELGAGIGDHTSFFLDRGCTVFATEARMDNLAVLRARYPNIEAAQLDLNQPGVVLANRSFDIVYCYGLLYHLSKPAEAIEHMAKHCRGMLLLETCVGFGGDESLNTCVEASENPSQSIAGRGCRPTRPWVVSTLKRHFPHVYLPVTQPNHEQFPIDWTQAPEGGTLTRAVFIASMQSIENELLVQDLPIHQRRH